MKITKESTFSEHPRLIAEILPPAVLPLMIGFAVILLFASSCGRSTTAGLAEESYGRIESMKETVEITWLMEEGLPLLGDGEEEDAEPEKPWFLGVVENRFNVSIVPVVLDISDFWSLEAFLESGRFPDCGMIDMDPYELFHNELIRSIPESTIRANMPGYTRFLDETFRPGWSILPPNNAPGREFEREYLSLCFPSASDQVPQEGVATRVDWARAVGFEFPGYEERKRPLNREETVFWLDADITLEWWENLLRAYRNGDPDGNGEIDSIPWPSDNRAYSGYSWMWTGIRGCFGPVEGPVVEDGELTMAEISNSYKQWCKMAQRWIREGLVDRDNFDRTAYLAWKKISQGLISASPVYLWGIDQDPQSIMPPATLAGEDKREVVVVPSLIGPTGQRGPYVLPRWGRKYFIQRDVDEEKLKRILQIIDFLYFSGEENFIYAHFGKPGIHFRWEGEAWNSQPVPRAAEDIHRGYPRIGGFGEPRSQTYFKDFMLVEIPRINAYTLDLVRFEVPGRIFELYDDVISGGIAGYEVKWPTRYDVFYDERFAALMAEHYESLNLHRLRFFWYITNDWIEVDDWWDDYVKNWKVQGGEELLEAIKNLPAVDEILGR